MIIQASGNLSRRGAPLSPKGKAFLPSGKTFNDNSGKRKPLSAQGATLPEGESFSAEREDKRYVASILPSGKTNAMFLLIFRVERLFFPTRI